MTAPAVAYSADNPFAPGGKYSADNPFAPGAKKPAAAPVAEPAAPAAAPVGMVEGVVSSAAQGATLGGSDELSAALDAFSPSGIGKAILSGENPIKRYQSVRDGLRATQRQFAGEHPNIALGAEVAGGVLPTLATGGLGALASTPARAGALYGAANAFGHGEGSAADQAKGTAIGGAVGGVLGGALSGVAKLAHKSGIPQRLADILPGGAKRQAVRAAATVIDPADAAPKLAARDALTPGSAVLGDTGPEASALGKVLGRSPKAAITGPQSASQRVAAVKASRKAIGADYDMLDRPMQADQQLMDLADAAGMPLPSPNTSFAELHRLRHEVTKSARRTMGMSKDEAYRIRNDIDGWLQARIPELADVDKNYTTTSQHLGDALRSLRSTTQGAVQGAVREGGSNARGADRPLSMWHQINQMLKPAPEKAGEAMESLLFDPKNTQSSLQAIGAQRARILNPQQPGGTTAAVLGQIGGAIAAPQLSTNAAQAKMQATELRMQGANTEALAAQLSALYTPDVVKFVMAATPNRIPQ